MKTELPGRPKELRDPVKFKLTLERAALEALRAKYPNVPVARVIRIAIAEAVR